MICHHSHEMSSRIDAIGEERNKLVDNFIVREGLVRSGFVNKDVPHAKCGFGALSSQLDML
jgi:hypothetical protein